MRPRSAIAGVPFEIVGGAAFELWKRRTVIAMELFPAPVTALGPATPDGSRPWHARWCEGTALLSALKSLKDDRLHEGLILARSFMSPWCRIQEFEARRAREKAADAGTITRLSRQGRTDFWAITPGQATNYTADELHQIAIGAAFEWSSKETNGNGPA